MAKISQQQKEFLAQSILEKSKEALADVIRLSDRQKYYEAHFLFKKLLQFITSTSYLDEVKLLSFSLYVMSIKYYEFFPEDTTWHMKHFHDVFDSIVKESESLIFLYRRLRPECKITAKELLSKLRTQYKAQTGKHYETYISFQEGKEEINIILTFWKHHLFSSIKKHKDDPSNLEHLDTLFVSLPKWVDSSYHMTRTKIRNDYSEDFPRLLEEYLNITEPLMPEISDMTNRALKNITMPDPSEVEHEITSEYTEKIQELKETAAIKIPKTGAKDYIKELRKVKKTAKEELAVLQKELDDKIKRILKKAQNDRNVLEKLHTVSENYRERVLVRAERAILKELSGIIWGVSKEPDEMFIQREAKRQVDAFIRSRMKEYNEQSAQGP